MEGLEEFTTTTTTTETYTPNKKHKGWGEDKKKKQTSSILENAYTNLREELTDVEEHVQEILTDSFPHLTAICVSDNIKNEMLYQNFHKYYHNKKTVMFMCRNDINADVINKRVRKGDVKSDTLILYNGNYRVIEGSIAELYTNSLGDVLRA